MAYDGANPVVVGYATKKDHYDVVMNNTVFLYNALTGAGDLGATWIVSSSRAVHFSDDTNVAHGMTAIVPTGVYGRLAQLSAGGGGVGGFNINGFTDADGVALNMSGVNGATSPAIASVAFNAYKKSGTSVTTLATTEKGFQFTNGGTIMTTIYGDGTFQWRDGAVAHGMTAIFPTDVWGEIRINSTTNGGMRLRGATDDDNIVIYQVGFSGAASSPTTTPIFVMDGYLKSGTSVTTLAGTNPLLALRNGGTNCCTVDASGKVALIGGGNTTTIDPSGAAVTFSTASGGSSILLTGVTSGDYAFSVAGTTYLTIKSAGGISNINSGFEPAADNTYSLGRNGVRWVAVWAVNGTIQTSDAREKNNVRDVPYGLAEVLALRPVAFTWKKDDEASLGFIAQEVWPLLPETCRPPATDKELWGMQYDRFVPVLVRAVQELAAKVHALEHVAR
jgi:hypothetical protein